VGEPALGLLQRHGVEPARYGAAALAAADQAGDFKHVEMLEHRRQRHRKRLGQRGDGEFRRLAEASQHGAPGRIGKGGEDAIQVVWLMVNHKVNLRGKICFVNCVVLNVCVVLNGYGGSPNLRRIASISASVGNPASLPRCWILCTAAARANRKCSSQVLPRFAR